MQQTEVTLVQIKEIISSLPLSVSSSPFLTILVHLHKLQTFGGKCLNGFRLFFTPNRFGNCNPYPLKNRILWRLHLNFLFITLYKLAVQCTLSHKWSSSFAKQFSKICHCNIYICDLPHQLCLSSVWCGYMYIYFFLCS